MKTANSKQSLISVIIPVYNAEKFLNKCIDSIVNQTYKKLEIILVDDGSPDNCPKICDEWAKNDNRIKVIHKQNGGVSSARNSGLCNASGEYIQFVDSDDYVELNYCEKLFYEMTNKKVDYIVSGFIIDSNTESQNIKVNEDIFIKNPTKNMEKVFEMQQTMILNSSCAKIFKKSILKNQKFNEQNAYGEDMMFSFDYLVKCKSVLIIKDCLYICNHKNENSLTVDYNYKKANMKAYSYNYIAKIYLKYGLKKQYKTLNANSISAFITYLIETAKKDKAKFFKDVREIRKNKLFFETYKNNSLGFKSKMFVFLIKLKLYKLLYLIIKGLKK